ncbi:MAG TPA: WD40 repeat domain-containing protein [Chthoniobacteraceae bacterium]|nr:WD40 repeat domain-containing protein [Chthoniobacteraceae bacterium]
MKIEKTRDLTLPTGVLGLALAPGGDKLYAACMDGHVYDVDLATGAAVSFSAKHESFASGCAVLPDGETLISSGYDGALLWHDTRGRHEIRRVAAHNFWSWQLALSPNSSLVASVTGQYLAGGEKYEPAAAPEATVKVFDARSGDLLHSFAHLPPVLSAAFSPDNAHLATANMMGEVCIWDLRTGNRAAQFTTADFTSWGIIKSPHYCGGIYALAFAPDGMSILCCGMGPMKDPMAGNGKMTWQRWAWNEAPPKTIAQISDGDGGAGLMETLAHHPDGQSFLMAGRQAQGRWNAAIFSTSDGALLASLDTKSRVTRAIYEPDGKTLFLAAAVGQPKRESDGSWPPYGRVHIVTLS